MSQPIKIYSFPLSGHAHRVELLVSLSGIEHQIINLDLAAGGHKQPPFLAINPVGQVPAIIDGDTKVSDSNAILVYLAKKYAPSYLPESPELAAEVQKFLTLGAGELIYGPAAARLINVFNASLDEDFTRVNAEKVFGKLEQHMQNREFLVANQPSIADISIYSYSAHAPEGGISLEPYPNLRRLLKNIEALPGFKPMPATAAGLLA